MQAFRESRSPRGAEAATFTEMMSVYEICIQIREIAKQLLEHSDDMALISVNAEVAATKSNLNKDAFIVLANETGRIAIHMSDLVGKIMGDSDALAKSSLAGVLRTRDLDKYRAGHARIQHAANQVLVQGAVDASTSLVTERMAEIRQMLAVIEDCRFAIEKQNVVIARVTTYFRIEASRDSEYGEYFNNISQSLQDLSASVNNVVRELARIISAAQIA